MTDHDAPATALDIAAIRARLAKITPGPWRTKFDAIVSGAADKHTLIAAMNSAISRENWQADEEFIAHAPADVLALLDALTAANARAEALEREREALRQAALDYADRWAKEITADPSTPSQKRFAVGDTVFIVNPRHELPSFKNHKAVVIETNYNKHDYRLKVGNDWLLEFNDGELASAPDIDDTPATREWINRGRDMRENSNFVLVEAFKVAIDDYMHGEGGFVPGDWTREDARRAFFLGWNNAEPIQYPPAAQPSATRSETTGVPSDTEWNAHLPHPDGWINPLPHALNVSGRTVHGGPVMMRGDGLDFDGKPASAPTVATKTTPRLTKLTKPQRLALYALATTEQDESVIGHDGLVRTNPVKALVKRGLVEYTYKEFRCRITPAGRKVLSDE